jgi:hypothetical protein
MENRRKEGKEKGGRDEIKAIEQWFHHPAVQLEHKSRKGSFSR